MTKQLLANELWSEIAPLLPPDPGRPSGGRPMTPVRDVLNSIFFVLFTATAWELLPSVVAHCPGMTCRRRLRDWHDMWIWETLHRRLLNKLNIAGEIDWSRACVDASSVRAKKGAAQLAQNPRNEVNAATNSISWPIETSSRSPLS